MKYWDLVEKCLVEFHRFNAADAHIVALRYKTNLILNGCDIGCAENEEAFYMACSVAGKEVREPTEDESKIYNKLLI